MGGHEKEKKGIIIWEGLDGVVRWKAKGGRMVRAAWAASRFESSNNKSKQRALNNYIRTYKMR